MGGVAGGNHLSLVRAGEEGPAYTQVEETRFCCSHRAQPPALAP